MRVYRGEQTKQNDQIVNNIVKLFILWLCETREKSKLQMRPIESGRK